MTDNELLAFAAKAVNRGSWHPMTHDTPNGVWNPLADDGDALRLAVKLAIDIEWRPDGRIAAYRHANANGYCFTAFESSREDRAAAARRAITRAAAEIGKAMP
jgi:hypothetical protein